MDLIQLGKEIRDARKKAKLSQEALGLLVGTQKEGIYRIEAGKQNICFNTLTKIANALGYRLPSKLLVKKKG